MKTFLWYIDRLHRVIGKGEHRQDAFTRLNPTQRNQVTFAEFSVEITEHRQRHASYDELLKLRITQNK